MENILHETQVFEKSSFLELVNSNIHLFYFSNFWNNWTKISKTEISGELNTQFIYTFSFCPRLEDIMKFEKDENKANELIESLLNDFHLIIYKHFEKLDYTPIASGLMIDQTNLYSRAFFVPSDNILTFIWVTSLEE